MRVASYFLAVAALLTTGGGALAQQSPPPELHAGLAALRGGFQENPDTGGASPAFDPIKHSLRDWLLARLPPERPTEESVTALADAVNSALRQADLFCPEAKDPVENGPCTIASQFFPLGYLDEVRLELLDRGNSGIFLTARTGIGVSCGFDVSAYIFAWSASGWRLAWQSEQNDYAKEKYRPGWIGEVEIGPRDEKSGERLVLTLGSNPACQSNFQAAYLRLWRMDARLEESRLLLERAETAYLGRNDPALLGDLGLDEATVEFATPSIDLDVHNREAVFHFEVSGNTVSRADPVALSPRDFVDEWLRRSWEESVLWTEPRQRDALATRHKAIREGADFVSGSFVEPTMRCTVRPGLWQVGIKLGATEEERDQQPPVYFLVRWQPPYRFRMADAADRPFPECFAPDPKASEWRTLFLGHGWQ